MKIVRAGTVNYEVGNQGW